MSDLAGPHAAAYGATDVIVRLSARSARLNVGAEAEPEPHEVDDEATP